MIRATRQYIDGIATALTKESGIKVISGKKWRANIKKRELEYNAGDLTQMEPMSAKGVILHEVGHLLFTKETKQTELEKAQPLMHEVYNAYEDIRMERELSDQYEGFANAPLMAHKEDIVKSMETCTDDSAEGVLYQVLSYSIFDATFYKTGQIAHRTINTPYEYRTKMTQKAREFLETHRRELDDIAYEASRAQSHADVKNIVDQKAYPILKKLLDQIPPEQQRQSVEKKAQEDESKAQPLTERKDTGDETTETIPPDVELDALLAPYINTLSHHLLTILKERKATKLTGLHKTGKLLSKNAYRVMTDEQRIFSRKTEPDKADYKITLCLDGSGSMRNKRHYNAYIGGFLLHRVFQRLGFQAEYIHFHDDVEQLKDYALYRNFRDNRNNNDAGALQMAYEHRDPDKDNIILMLTDGNICTDVAPWVTKLRKAGAILFGIGIGIRGDELVRNYGHAINVPEVSDLPSALIGIMKRLIHR